jgi:hypothetical protein
MKYSRIPIHVTPRLKMYVQACGEFTQQLEHNGSHHGTRETGLKNMHNDSERQIYLSTTHQRREPDHNDSRGSSESLW